MTDQLIAGGVAGLCAWAVSYPLDVVKTRVQSLPVAEFRHGGWRHNTMSVIRTIWRTEGMRGFWRGFGPCIVPSFPANALGFVAYELAIAGFIRIGWSN